MAVIVSFYHCRTDFFSGFRGFGTNTREFGCPSDDEKTARGGGGGGGLIFGKIEDGIEIIRGTGNIRDF